MSENITKVTIDLTIAEELVQKLEEAQKQVQFVQGKLLAAREGIRRAGLLLTVNNKIECQKWLNYADDALKALDAKSE